ncbi:MAG: ABC transporter substrate-binding protein [Synechococcus sp.]
MTPATELPMSAFPPAPRVASLTRRDLLQLGVLLGLGGLAGCTRSATPTVMAAPETLPLLWRRRLPKPWRFSALESSQPWPVGSPAQADLLALPDGWISTVAADALQPMAAPSLQNRLSAQAMEFLAGFAPAQAAALLPVSVSPWVLLFRRDARLRSAQTDGWRVLLDPALVGQLVLPSSPRVVMSIAERLDHPDALQRLRSAALVFDDRHALNWLLQGKARAAVLPLVRCMATLRSDPRVHAVLPEQGAPLHWTVLMRPAQTREPLPQSWVEEAWMPPLLGRLLRDGWVPPLPPAELQQARHLVPTRLQSVVLPSQQIWDQCWSFPPLTVKERSVLEARWSASAP